MGRETNRVSKEMRGAINKVSRKLVLDVNRRLAEGTPVDTAWARSNWISSKDKPIDGVVGSKVDVQLGAVAQGIIQIESWDLFKGSAFITNNVPYINKLNAGYSPQAPPGFVQNSIEQGISGLSNQVLK